MLILELEMNRVSVKMSSSRPQKRARRACSTIIIGGLLMTASILCASPPQLVSARNPAMPLSVSGDGDSVIPWLSPDGRFVVFSSSANDLVTNDNGQFGLDVFLHDCVSNLTVLVSANMNGTGGGNGNSRCGQISTNGRYVVFQSDASDLLPGDTNGANDIFMRDLEAGTNILVSVAANGGWANGDSTSPVMTPDGRWVAFISSATNLAAGDTNGIPDIFVRDLVNRTTTWVTVGASGPNSVVSSPVITPDGRFVAFFSSATNLAAGVPSLLTGEIYVRDRLAGTTIWASVNAALICSNILQTSPSVFSLLMPSSHPVISDDGRYVAFKTGWTNGTVTPPAGTPAVIFFQYDSVNQTTTIVSTNGYAPWVGCDDVYGPEMTPDGRFIAFVQREIAGGKTNASVRLWDRQTGANVLVSAGANGLWPTNSTSYAPALSADGRYVTFLSDATNIMGTAVTNGMHLYRCDLQTTNMVLVDTDTNGMATGDMSNDEPSLSADGSCIAFATPDGGLVPGDVNHTPDVFLWNSATGTNQLISSHNPLALFASGNRFSALGACSISGDGGRVAFASLASDLVPNDFNQDYDVFVCDLTANSNILASVGLDGNSALGGPSYNPVISTDGRYVIFISGATNLVANVTNKASNIYRRDLQSGATVLVSVDSNGAGFGTNSLLPACSQDGRYVAFLCRTNLSSALTNVFWRDLSAGATYLVSSNANPTIAISLSAGGQRLAYFDTSPNLYVWDANLSSNIYTNTTPGLIGAAISPGGNRLLCQTTNQLFVGDVASGLNLFVFPSTVPLLGSSPWSGDERYVAFVTATSLAAGDNNGTNDVYLCDLQTGTLTLVSVNQTGTASAAGASDSPAVSADGRFVVFRTFAPDVSPGILSPPSLVAFDRLTGSNTVVVTGVNDTDWTTWLSQPVFSTNSTSIAFQSWDSGLVGGDLNRADDVFAAGLNVFAVTNSTSPNIVLTFQLVTGTSGSSGGGSLNWNAVPGSSYYVLSTTNLNDPIWQVFPGNATVVGSHGYFNVQAGDAQRFFLIQCGD